MSKALRYISAISLSVLAMLTGCERKTDPTSTSQKNQLSAIGPLESDVTQETHGQKLPSAIMLPPNVPFSTPGTYQSPNGKLFVTIERRPNGNVTYDVWQKIESGTMTMTNIANNSAPVSEKGLVVCWDKSGQPWFYHPVKFVWYSKETENGFTNLFAGSGSKVRDKMPVAFRKNLPEDIEEMAKRATASGVWKFPAENEDLREHEDSNRPAGAVD